MKGPPMPRMGLVRAETGQDKLDIQVYVLGHTMSWNLKYTCALGSLSALQ
jgi:hypothetical protein